jgi:hypothetical protein
LEEASTTEEEVIHPLAMIAMCEFKAAYYANQRE